MTAATSEVGTSAERSGDGSSDALDRLDGWFELLLMGLGLVWLGLLVAELVATPPRWTEHVATAIWGIFAADFVVRLALTSDRRRYLRVNWLTLVALLVPAVRVFRLARFVRVLRAARAVRGIRALRLVTTFSRARRAIHRLLAQRHALGYVVMSTLAVVVLGAAGMVAFERGNASAFDGYGHALWWTAMLVMTMGTEGWPQTIEGRALSFALALYGFAMLGYITASLASWFIGRERPRQVTPDADQETVTP